METRVRLSTLFIAAAFIGLAGTGRRVGAQPAALPTANMLLERLVGDWRMVGQARGRPVTYDLVAKHVLGGRYIELHMKDVARPAQYEALVFIGADTLPNRVLVHWLDSFGAAYSVPPGAGAVSGDTVRFEVPYHDRPFRDTFVFHPADRSWVFRLEASDGRGGWKTFAEYAVHAH
jgi:hypothetical protein